MTVTTTRLERISLALIDPSTPGLTRRERVAVRRRAATALLLHCPTCGAHATSRVMSDAIASVEVEHYLGCPGLHDDAIVEQLVRRLGSEIIWQHIRRAAS